MPARGYRASRTQKPPMGVGLDPSYPVPPCFAMVANEGGGAPLDLATGIAGTAQDVLPLWSSSAIGPALSFTGTQSIQYTLRGANKNESTMAFRITPSSVTGAQILVQMGTAQGSTGNNWSISLTGTSLALTLFAGTSHVLTSTATAAIGVPMTIVVLTSVSTSREELWVSKAGVTTLDTGSTFVQSGTSNTYAMFGRSETTGGGSYFHGSLDYWYLFPMALSQAQVAALINDPWAPIQGDRILRRKRGEMFPGVNPRLTRPRLLYGLSEQV